MREKADEIFAWGLAQRQDELVWVWENHSRATAKVAEAIAAQCGMDADKAYVCGLLHDIGKYGDMGMGHAWLGYEKMMAEEMPEVAKVCLTHSFNPKDKVAVLDYKKTEHTEFIKDFVAKAEYDDYDFLIQLADYMSGAHGVTTIERRFCSVLVRHNLPNAQEELVALYRLKMYFDEKCGMDIYELFHDEIAAATFRGLPGNIGRNKELKFTKKEDD